MPDKYLVQLSNTTDKPYFIQRSVNHVFGVHMHDFYEIELCCEGTGINRIDGEEHPFTPGTCFLYFPHTIHELYADQPQAQPFALIDIAYTEGFLHEDCMRVVEQFGDPVQIQLEGALFSNTVNSFARLLARQGEVSENFFHERIFRAQLESLVYEIAERYLSVSGLDIMSASMTGGRGENDIQRVLRYIAQNLGETLSISVLSSVAHVSPTYFSEYFKTHVGISYREYITNLRMKRAMHLVCNSDYPAKAISEICGFDSQSSFSHAFKAHYGNPPSYYRREEKK